MVPSTWKDRLEGRLPAALAEEIDIFETQMALRRQGRLDEKIFAESRLRRGIYGQRYDNGQRHDGVRTRTLDFPCGPLTKGPSTVWDAPGMMRIKIPMGRVSAEQLDLMAELAEEYADHILHVTTRQDIQLHFVHIEDTPSLMRRLASVGITTREACGNSVRNVTACPYAGVCNTESFDVTPYAHATAWFLLGHKDTQDFGRKFKIAFSGCREEACALTSIHDIGALGIVRDGRRGFEFYVGGGLGSVPRPAQLLDAFIPEEELLPMAQAVSRVFARYGEKQKRMRARLKFLIEKIGIDEFRRLVFEERAVLPPDPRWTSYLEELHARDERPLRPGAPLDPAALADATFARWFETNVRPQSQPGYAVATVRLPLGDLTSSQTRALADLARRFTGDTVRLTVEQNIVFRWMPQADLPAFHAELTKLGLASPGASTIVDVVSCPGTDTCKLGISSSRGLSGVLQQRLAARADELHPDVRRLHVKTSGCFNSCGQHHVADIGFLGVSRNLGGRRVAHFQLVVGGEWTNNGGAYGLAIGAYPSKNVPKVLDRLTELWIAERTDGERFQAFIGRVGRARIKEVLEDLTRVPAHAEDPSFYTDWGDAREYTVGDMGVGECAGEIVSVTEFGLAASEREVFQAQLLLEKGDLHAAAQQAYRSMLSAAQALIRLENIDVKDEPDAIVDEFRVRFYDTQLFFDPFAGGKFAYFLFKTHEAPPNGVSRDEAHRHIEEATLFIEAAHACHARLQERAAAR
jgi:sulfite reductase (ferredoxin)